MTFILFVRFVGGNDCDSDHPCDQCTAVDIATRNVYLKHCASLKTKRQHKAKAAVALPVHVPDVADSVPSPNHPVSPALPPNLAILPVDDSSPLLV